jgi:hypothetical protein
MPKMIVMPRMHDAPEEVERLSHLAFHVSSLSAARMGDGALACCERPAPFRIVERA